MIDVADYGRYLPPAAQVVKFPPCKSCGRPVRRSEALVIGENGDVRHTSRLNRTDDVLHERCSTLPPIGQGDAEVVVAGAPTASVDSLAGPAVMPAPPARPLTAAGGRIAWLDGIFERTDHELDCVAGCLAGAPCEAGEALATAERDAWSAWYVARVRDGVL